MILNEIYSIEVRWNESEHKLEFYAANVIGEVGCIYGWEKGCEYIVDPRYKHRIWPNFYLDVLDHENERDIHSWFSTLDTDAWSLVRQSKCYKLDILQLTSLYSEACDLAIHNPILLLLLIFYGNANELRVGDIGKLIQCANQKDILKSIGLMGSKSSIKLMRKVKLSSIGENDVKILNRVFSDPELLHRLRHKIIINNLTLMIIEWRDWIINTDVESVVLKNQNLSMSLINDAVRMGGSRAIEELKNCSSLNGVTRVHDKFMQLDLDKRMLEKAKKGHGVFPRPPLRGDGDKIKPIESMADLLTHASYMKHCVASYSNEIHDRKYYVYKFADFEIATIGLYINKSTIRLDQIRGRWNSKVSFKSRSVIYQWLESRGVSAID